MTQVMTDYPPAEYPRLYPKPIDYYSNSHRAYRIINQVIFIIGLMILSALFVWDYMSDGLVSPMIPWAYFMVQMMPLLYLELSEFSCFKQMRKADLPTTRKAELIPRHLFDVVSPTLFTGAVLAYIAAIIFVLYINNFAFYWGSKALLTILIFTAGNLFFAGIIFWNLYGKKLDPYQTGKDRIKLMKVTVKSLIYVSIGVSIFITITQAINRYDMDILEPLMMSLFLQFISLASIGERLQTLRIEEFDLEVYKNDAANQKP